MNRFKLVPIFSALFFALALTTVYAQPAAKDQTTQTAKSLNQPESKKGSMVCPYCGHDLSGICRHGMGPMHEGMWGMPPRGKKMYQKIEPLDMKQAKQYLENCLDYIGNPNLKVGKMEDKGTVFSAEIVTQKEGALVDKIVINKYSHMIHSIY